MPLRVCRIESLILCCFIMSLHFFPRESKALLSKSESAALTFLGWGVDGTLNELDYL